MSIYIISEGAKSQAFISGAQGHDKEQCERETSLSVLEGISTVKICIMKFSQNMFNEIPKEQGKQEEHPLKWLGYHCLTMNILSILQT